MSLAIKRGKRRGDPGLWSTIRDVGVGYLQGGFGGAIGAIPGIGAVAPARPGIQINPPFGGPPGAGWELTTPGGFQFGASVGETAEAIGMLAPGMNGRNGAVPSGYHWNKTGYFVKGPPPRYIEAGTKLVKNRRRNPLNPRAFDRALGRISSAKRFGAKLGKVTIRKTCACK